MPKTVLLIIDPQIDFCDPAEGALYVSGAQHDMKRLANMINRHQNKIDEIYVTLDSHHLIHIAHPIFWCDADGNHPAPFTSISLADVKNKRWMPTLTGGYERALAYVQALEREARYTLTIWHPHCLIGSRGHAVFPVLFNALAAWETKHFKFVDYIAKGGNAWTEHYSAIQADVPDAEDPATHINLRLIKNLQQSDLVLIAGEALTHCVANTVRDLVDNNSGDKLFAEKLLLLEDATSSIPGFETHGQNFISELNARGMQLTKTTDVRL